MIFVDTSFWAALRNPQDRHRAAATALMTDGPPAPLLTTDLIRGECWTLVGRRRGHQAAVEMLDLLDESNRLSVEVVTPEDQDVALAWLRRHDEREYSFVDATSFAVMRRRRIHEVFAFDDDFAAAGFVELRP